MNIKEDFNGINALVMGLGLHGGGRESALFLARRGAALTITDLRDEATLRPQIEALDTELKLAGRPPARYVLGRHEIADFQTADVVIKNPGVRPDSPYLKAARRVETDISLFLRENPARLFAVTGSKGKSFTASALHFGLAAYHKTARRGSAYLGGNITLSPLSFIDKLSAYDDVVLELSSWQLGDLKAGLLKPRTAIITAIMPDHLDRYRNMAEYVADKKRIYANQDEKCALFLHDGQYAAEFQAESRARTAIYGLAKPAGAGGWHDTALGTSFAAGPLGALDAGSTRELLSAAQLVCGEHQKVNLLGAALAMFELGDEETRAVSSLESFPGIEHRLEFFHEHGGVRYYNDTAATIPEAALAAVEALGRPILVAGGTDKALEFAPLVEAARRAKAVILLAGTAGDKLSVQLDKAGIAYSGPFTTITAAAESAIKAARSGDSVILSPGCASFGMFKNEFDRGAQWKAVISHFLI
ncbi:MAG: UDP-N-acetylmuramoyl-L-alanine--D-glutamate ligase [Spirochaetaceae bacterium]|jgi:UDP-N-acetylmuramoylalanine--D-glutamate ligase|nr:UDP-N-acetylmuramoyl-L-alanine--D-glutamate ligase [Spirochaetaceae bacterium]